MLQLSINTVIYLNEFFFIHNRVSSILCVRDVPMLLMKISEQHIQEKFWRRCSECLDFSVDYCLSFVAAIYAHNRKLQAYSAVPLCLLQCRILMALSTLEQAWPIASDFMQNLRKLLIVQHFIRYRGSFQVPLQACLSPFFSRDKSHILYFHTIFILSAKRTSQIDCSIMKD